MSVPQTFFTKVTSLASRKSKIALIIVLAVAALIGLGIKHVRPPQPKPEDVFLSLPHRRSLTPAEARVVAANSRLSLDLSTIESLGSDVAKELSRFPDIISLNGLRSLSAEEAAYLAMAAPSASLELNGLPSLSVAAALALAKARCSYISLNSVQELSPELANALVAYGTQAPLGSLLRLDGLRSVSLQVAEKLGHFHASGLSMNGLKDLGASEAEALASFRGTALLLGGLEKAEKGTIEAIARFNGFFMDLGGLESLSESQAGALACFRGNILRLEGLIKPSNEVLGILGKLEGRVWLPRAILKENGEGATDGAQIE
jgi:hypothetical protein